MSLKIKFESSRLSFLKLAKLLFFTHEHPIYLLSNLTVKYDRILRVNRGNQGKFTAYGMANSQLKFINEIIFSHFYHFLKHL
jgi:hypothetical protein